MSSIPGYFEYPYRRPGLDHDWYPHRYLIDAPQQAWPDDAPIALWITVSAHHYPLDMDGKPFMPVGGMTRLYPDMWNYTLRDYGNRVGIYRIMRVLDELGLKASVPMSARTATRYPRLVEEIVARDWEIMASGRDMGLLHHGGLPVEAERAVVEEVFATLREASGQGVTGWHSPEHSASSATATLAMENSARYVADFVNDDMPFAFSTDAGKLWALPLPYETADKRVLYVQNQSLAEWEAQLIATFDCLLAEAKQGKSRLFPIALTPWVIGQPYRIQALVRVLEHVLAACTPWVATGSMIAEHLDSLAD